MQVVGPEFVTVKVRWVVPAAVLPPVSATCRTPVEHVGAAALVVDVEEDVVDCAELELVELEREL